MTKRLQLNSVVKKFGGVTAVNGLSFDVFDGESLALIGPNGAGKTTILSLIMGEHRQNSGSIRFGDKEISRLPTHVRIQHGIARTYQIPRPFAGMDVLHNIRVGMMPDSLWDMLIHMPNYEAEIELARSVGFSDADLQRNPKELSMGDLRKLELARTLATEPNVVLLDEVFAGLTVAEIAQMSELITTKRRQGITFVIVSHDLRSLEPLVDRAVAMTFGKNIASGSFQQVMDNEQVRNTYLGT